MVRLAKRAGASPAGRRPACRRREWIMLTSSASPGVRSGSSPGRRAASIDLPEPGGPISRRLWPPAAAISSARLRRFLPLARRRGRACARPRRCCRRPAGSAPGCRLKWLIRASRSVGARTSDLPGPGRLAALARPGRSARGRARGADRARAARRPPGSASRRATTRPARRNSAISSRGSTPMAASSASAIGRSKWLPSLSRSAGARLIEDALRRQRQAHRGQRRAHPLARFAHRLVGQADDQEGRQAGRRSAPAPRPARPRCRRRRRTARGRWSLRPVYRQRYGEGRAPLSPSRRESAPATRR